jgi:hypothetical protein
MAISIKGDHKVFGLGLYFSRRRFIRFINYPKITGKKIPAQFGEYFQLNF